MFFLVLGVLLFANKLEAQTTVRGYVYDENNMAIPFVNVFVKELQQGTTTDIDGKFAIVLQPGQYLFIFSSVGYEKYEVELLVKDQEIIKNIWLSTSNTELNEIVVKAKKKDPAYDIIAQVIENKQKYLGQINSRQSKVYIKATEISNKKEVVLEVAENQANDVLPTETDDTSDTTKTKKKDIKNINIYEVEMLLHYQYPNKYKEERSAVRFNGSTSGLFVPRFSQVDLNFYNNLVYMNGIAEMPIISPLSSTAILTYKYKLEDVYMVGDQMVYKIKVWPRKTGNSSLSGYIHVNNKLWNVRRFELELYKGSLKLYDAFSLNIDYKQYQDSLWLVALQEFNYLTKQNRKISFEGTTTISYDSVKLNVVYPKKFFGNEVAKTAQDAYEKDSTYWGKIRPVPLTKDEQIVVRRSDSIKNVTSSKAYKDSMDAIFNKVTLLEVVWEGVGFRKSDNYQIYLPAVLSMWNFQVVGGLRLGPYFSAYKRFKSGRTLSFQNYLSFGTKNKDLQGNIGARFRYSPFKFADVWLYGGKYFSSINWFDAYLNQLSVSNYILAKNLQGGHYFEIVNGLFATTEFDFTDRQALTDYDSRTFLNNWLGEPEPLQFDGYQTFSTTLKLSYTPFMQYATEPTRKVLLGSRWPTFTTTYTKGYNKLFGSDVDYDYIEASIYHRFNVGVLGKSLYTAKTGTFTNTKNLKYIDYKRFRESDPYLYSNPLYSFQLLDTSLAISSQFYELHYIHHFNGALINNIPLLKKTKIMALAGAGALWVGEANYRYVEAFVGIERSFKLGARRRLKIGLYGVVGESNTARTRPDFKVSFDIIDTWKKNWSY